MRDCLWLCLIGLLAFLPGLSGLPVIDRDEARYAQAAVQMIESGDYIDIRFQDQARHKKPAGAYWAQVGALALSGQIDDVQRGERAIWAHRLPSVIGALIAVLATYFAGLNLFGRREGFAGAILLAVSVSLVFEAHQAKTDAMLAGACAAALYGLSTRRPWPTWLALAFGTLLKGPVIIGVAALALITDGVTRRSLDRVRPVFKPLPIIAALAICLPWFIAIGLKTDGAFFAEALGRDFGSKITSAQETHGGPPGYYLLTSVIMFWPGIFAVPFGLAYAWRNRREANVIWLLSWLVPMWLLLEIVPTKLPHYTLPLYPALALLAGAGLIRLTSTKTVKWIGLGLAIIAGVTLTIILCAVLIPVDQSQSISPLNWISGIVLSLIFGSLIVWMFKSGFNQDKDITAFGLLSAGFCAAAYGAALSQSPLFDLTPRLIEAVPSGQTVVSPDYREPSLVFRAGTQTGLSAAALKQGDYLILSRDNPPPLCAVQQAEISGVNYAKGNELTLVGYDTSACRAADIRQWAAEASAP